MDYIKELRKFVFSQQLYSGVRVTAGSIIPAYILYHFGLLTTMIAIPLGALCVSIADTPGPLVYRRNSLLASIVTNFFVVLITGYLRSFTPLVIVLIVVFGMLFNLIAVYGSRVSSIGLIALLVFIFNIDRHLGKTNILETALLFSAGGVWYTLLSLALHSIRPYKLIQQSLGACLMETANYLQVKGLFYNPSPDYSTLYDQLMRNQINIRQHHDDLREMLFKTRKIVSESTVRSRILMLMFQDSIDLFERIATSQQDYATLHEAFDGTGILEKYQWLITRLSKELHDIGLAIQSGFPSKPDEEMDAMLNDTMNAFLQLRKEKLTPETIEKFIMLRQILYSLQDIAERIKRLHRSTTYDKKLSREYKKDVDLEKFISHQEIDPKILIDNLSLKSSNFRHAIRVTVGMLAGYIISLMFPLGHGYWILLTIAVIIKPAYSITRKRNAQRLAGTVLGALAGFTILYFIKDTTALFIVMVLAMLLSYSFIRQNYFVGTLGITLYVLISFSFLSPHGFGNVLTDRLLDTFIGSVIAYITAAFVLPTWEHQQIQQYIIDALQANRKYFNTVACTFAGKPPDTTSYKVDRKNAFVALANLSDNFQRMLSEPKNKQRNMQHYHQFVASNHMLTSYIASLSYYAQRNGCEYASEEFVPIIAQIDKQFAITLDIIENHKHADIIPVSTPLPPSKKVQELLEMRRQEMSSGYEGAMTTVRKTLSDLKTINIQFELINTITIDQVRILDKLTT